MATIIVPPAAADPSMAELRAMVGATTTAAEPSEAKPETPENAAPAAEATEAASEPAEPKSNPEESEEPELPEGVKKRIAKEADRAARAQAAIDRAVSDRKAKEAQAAKLTAEEKGSQPVKTAESSSEKPKRPVFGEAGHESETWAQFETRSSGHDDKLAEWVKTEAVREFKANQAAETAVAKRDERVAAAVAKHGKDFPALMDKACEVAPQGLQLAISALETRSGVDWSDVAVHLAKDPAQLQELSAKFAVNPYSVIATLGRIQASLTSKESKTATTEKPLPEPLKKVGGTASASGQSYQEVIENGSIAQLRALVNKTKK